MKAKQSHRVVAISHGVTKNETAHLDRKSAIGENVGISGTAIILDKNSSVLRRTFWLCLILFMFGVMIWQIVERFELFFNNPVAVNFEVQYEEEVRFPVIVICNANTATLSGTYGMNLVLDDGSIVNTIRQLNALHNAMQKLDKNASALNETLPKLQALYGPAFDEKVSKSSLQQYSYMVSHKLKNMLKQCFWQKELCTVNDFQAILEPYTLNQCYVFNWNRTRPLYTTSPGTDGGLTVVLDAQQYDYFMVHTTQAAGFYVSIYDDLRDINSSMTGAAFASAGTFKFLCLHFWDQ